MENSFFINPSVVFAEKSKSEVEIKDMFFTNPNISLPEKEEDSFFVDCTTHEHVDRNYKKGKSFRCKGEWSPIETYIDDDFYQDFVSYGGALWVYNKTSDIINTNLIPGESPEWTKVVQKGDTGISGNLIISIGEGLPKEVDTKFYLNVNNGDLYKNIESRWKLQGKLSVYNDDLEWKDE